MKAIRTLLVSALAVLVVVSAAMATPAWYKAFNDLYKPKAGTDLAKGRCMICHEKASGGARNAYGKLLDGKKIDADSLKAIEKVDLFKNGYTNIEKIKAGMLPADPKAKPKK